MLEPREPWMLTECYYGTRSLVNLMHMGENS